MGFLKNKYVRSLLPALLSAVAGICGNAVFSLGNNTMLFIVAVIALILSFLFDILLIVYYVSLDNSSVLEEERIKKEIEEFKSKNEQLVEEKNALDNIIIGLQKCFDENSEKLYTLVENARKKRVIDLHIWNKIFISDFVCNNLLPFITSIAETGDSFSVSIIIPKEEKVNKRKKISYIMLSYEGKDKQKPHIYNQPIPQKDAYKYYYGKIFKNNNPEISCLMTPEEINSEFYFSDSSKKGKYQQYIGIPICCDGKKMIGLLQVVANNGSIISSDKNKINNIINKYITCFSDFMLFADKVEKGISLDLH